MDEMAKIASLTSHWTMIIFARNCPVVSDFDQLVINLDLLLLLLNIHILKGLDLTLDVLNLFLMIKSELDQCDGFYVVIRNVLIELHMQLNLLLHLLFLVYKKNRMVK
jgi:hypothetical protein